MKGKISSTLLDGGFGTALQQAGLPAGTDPADWNVERPDAVLAVHRAYVEAGSDILLTNTFGANSLKYHGTHALGDLVAAGVQLAREAAFVAGRAVRVALDVGPTGRLLAPAGDLSAEDAFVAFRHLVAAGVASGVDLVYIETMGDIRELKTAVLAAREVCALPVWASVALGEDGKLLTGGSVEAVATVLESLGVEAYGFNCGLGPDRLIPFVERLRRVSTHPLIVKPNAGIPKIRGDETVFEVDPETFARHVERLAVVGADIVGGCCGTTPAHIAAVARILKREPPMCRSASPETSEVVTRVASGTEVLELRPHAGVIIGERINPTGKKALREALVRGDTAYILREAVRQEEAGAAALDVNCGVPGLDEASALAETVASVEGVVTRPLQIDTADPKALGRALRLANGKPLVNSVTGKQASMDAVFPLVKRYGGAIVALCLDESGIPATAEGRLAVARRILDEGAKYGFRKNDFVFDALTLAVSAEPQAAVVTLETVRRLTEELRVNTVLGVSNVSFGLPDRIALNNTMYALAKRAGLSAAIANPMTLADAIDPAAEDVLLGRDARGEAWIRRASEKTPRLPQPIAPEAREGDLPRLAAAIRRGLRDDAAAAATAVLTSGAEPMEVVRAGIVPALEEIGARFERGETYLPQLLTAADAAGSAFAAVRSALNKTAVSVPKGRPVVLATVRGDIHDIGKNIVRALLENYGFDVIDLGRDVPPERIVTVARENKALFVGLSALMTTTVGSMAETIRQLKASGADVPTCVGGAVVTQDYADQIGADFYAKDAMRTVRYAERLRAQDACD